MLQDVWLCISRVIWLQGQSWQISGIAGRRNIVTHCRPWANSNSQVHNEEHVHNHNYVASTNPEMDSTQNPLIFPIMRKGPSAFSFVMNLNPPAGWPPFQCKTYPSGAQWSSILVLLPRVSSLHFHSQWSLSKSTGGEETDEATAARLTTFKPHCTQWLILTQEVKLLFFTRIAKRCHALNICISTPWPHVSTTNHFTYNELESKMGLFILWIELTFLPDEHCIFYF